jgi:tetratricopeptide (TPR) repeat protein
VGRLVAILAVLGAVLAGCQTPTTRSDRAAFDDGYAAFQKGQWQPAIDGFTRYLRSDSSKEARGEVYYYRGQALVHANRRSEALRDFQQALASSPPQPILAYTHVAIGNLYYEEGNDPRAINAYDQALKGPQSELPMDMLLLRLSTSLQHEGKWSTADKYLALLINQYPTSAAAADARRRYKATFFSIQTGAFSTLAGAQAQALRLRDAAFTPRMTQITRNGQTLYAVQVGSARTFAEATTLAGPILKAGFPALIVP